jgi:hypothetical protein
MTRWVLADEWTQNSAASDGLMPPPSAVFPDVTPAEKFSTAVSVRLVDVRVEAAKPNDPVGTSPTAAGGQPLRLSPPRNQPETVMRTRSESMA